MAKEKVKQKCFIIMPITTPANLIDQYNSDADHFTHVLDHLFVPALEKAGFDPVPPKATGSNIIQAEIIKQLSVCDLVLCDMSILNANVFFEFGIRTALNKPVALVVDDKTLEKVPFDTGIINHYQYSSSLVAWEISDDIDGLTEHLKSTFKKTNDHNALWKYFGVAQTGAFKPEESTEGDKLDLIMKEIASLKDQTKDPYMEFNAPIKNISYSEKPYQIGLRNLKDKSVKLGDLFNDQEGIKYLKLLEIFSKIDKK
jgi:nucleoside 2-deoxyribosyltransferase